MQNEKGTEFLSRRQRRTACTAIINNNNSMVVKRGEQLLGCGEPYRGTPEVLHVFLCKRGILKHSSCSICTGKCDPFYTIFPISKLASRVIYLMVGIEAPFALAKNVTGRILFPHYLNCNYISMHIAYCMTWHTMLDGESLQI